MKVTGDLWYGLRGVSFGTMFPEHGKSTYSDDY